MERVLSKRKQFARGVATVAENKANGTTEEEVKRELTGCPKCLPNGDIVVDPVTGNQTVCSFRSIFVVWYLF
jgi:hypothetical protein